MCTYITNAVLVSQESVSQVGQTLALTELLPTVHCVSPRRSMEIMDENGCTGMKCTVIAT